MALSAYDKELLSEEDQQKINEYTAAWESANKTGDTTGMADANAGANAVRAGYGYTGGTSGDQFVTSGTTGYKHKDSENAYGSTYDQINSQYNAALQGTMSDLASQEAKIDPYYAGVKNNAAANMAQSQNAWNEFANANGINVGTGAQAGIARQNVYGNALYSADTAAANAKSDINLQRSKAQSEVEREKSAAILAEMQRQQELAQSEKQYQDSLALQLDQNYQNKSAAEYSKQKEAADALASSGDYSGYKSLYGWTDAQVASANKIWKQQYQASFSTGSSGSGSSAYKPTLTYSQVMDALDRGIKDPNVLRDYQYYMGNSYNSTGLSDTATTLQSQLDANRDRGGNVTDTILRPLLAAAKYGTITEQDFITLMNRYGLNYTEYIS